MSQAADIQHYFHVPIVKGTLNKALTDFKVTALDTDAANHYKN